MCDPATAILGAGVGSAAAGVIGGGISAQASQAAASTQAAAATHAADLQYQAEQQALAQTQQQYQTSLGFAQQQYQAGQARTQPFVDAGTTALGNLTNMLGPLTANQIQDLTNTPLDLSNTYGYGTTALQGANTFGLPSNLAALSQTPGYQFNLQQGQLAAQNAQAAQGLGTSGSAEKAAMQFASGLAGTTYQNQFQNYINANQLQASSAQATNQQFLGQNTLASQSAQATNQQQIAQNQLKLAQLQQNYGMYQTLAQMGGQTALGSGQLGTASANTIGQLGASTSANIGNILTQNTATIGQGLTSAGAAQAAGTVGAANALTGALGNVSGAGSNTALLLALNQAGIFGGAGGTAGNQSFSGGGSFQ